MSNLKFGDRLSALGQEAKQYIEFFMEDKEDVFVNGYTKL